jgi:hypothetical protein
MDYGPIITAAFSSKNENDVYCLRRLICDMIERSPQKKKSTGLSDAGYSSAYDSDARSVRSKYFSLFYFVSFSTFLHF